MSNDLAPLFERDICRLTDWALAGALRAGGVHATPLWIEGEALDPWRAPDGTIGALFGIEVPGAPRTIEIEHGEVRLVGVQLLSPREVQTVREAGAERLAEQLRRGPSAGITRLG